MKDKYALIEDAVNYIATEHANYMVSQEVKRIYARLLQHQAIMVALLDEKGDASYSQRDLDIFSSAINIVLKETT